MITVNGESRDTELELAKRLFYYLMGLAVSITSLICLTIYVILLP